MSIDNSSKVLYPSFKYSFLAGGAAHLGEVLLLGHILDRIKVEQETNLNLRAIGALCSIWEKGGWNTLYRGLKWNVASSVFKGSCGWTLHNFSNQCIMQLHPQTDLTRPSTSFAILVGLNTAFLETSLILCPLERLKTVEMTSFSKQKSKIRDFIKKEGVGFLYRGWHIVMLRQSCSWVSYLGIYQQLRQSFLGVGNEDHLSLKQKVFLGGLTGALVAAINTPLDLLKTHAQKANVAKVDSAFITMRNILQVYGLRGLYNGLSIKVLRQTWSSAFILIALDRLGALPVNMRI